jgi:hypothetical protein
VKRQDGWLRRYWQGLIIAAAVSYGQLQPTVDTGVVAAQRHAYVWMLPDRPPGLHPGEVVGRSVLTVPLDVDPDRAPN